MLCVCGVGLHAGMYAVAEAIADYETATAVTICARRWISVGGNPSREPPVRAEEADSGWLGDMADIEAEQTAQHYRRIDPRMVEFLVKGNLYLMAPDSGACHLSAPPCYLADTTSCSRTTGRFIYVGTAVTKPITRTLSPHVFYLFIPLLRYPLLESVVVV